MELTRAHVSSSFDFEPRSGTQLALIVMFTAVEAGASMAESLGDMVFLVVKQKQQLAKKAVVNGIYRTLDLAERAHKASLDNQEIVRQSVLIRRGSVLSNKIVDYKGDEFKPFADDNPGSGSWPRRVSRAVVQQAKVKRYCTWCRCLIICRLCVEKVFYKKITVQHLALK